MKRTDSIADVTAPTSFPGLASSAEGAASAARSRRAVLLGLASLPVACADRAGFGGEAGGPIRVGILHSSTGTMAISEGSVADATRLALEEIDGRGGVLGRRLEAVAVDGASKPSSFAAEAERLIVEEKVSVIFGCWTSASRRTVKPILERLDHLLFYPVQYEGLEQSPNIVYTGAAPNQQIIPAVKWSFDHLGKRAFLVGSDYVFPRTANALMRAQIDALRGEVVGEAYVPLGSRDVSAIVDAIAASKPDVVLNTINGDTNVPFFAELGKRIGGAQLLPVMSFSLAEDELRAMGAASVVGHYATWNYFQSVATPENAAFVRRFKARYGADRVTDDPMESAYAGVHLWAQAAESARSVDPREVRKKLRDQSYLAPGGLVSIDAETQHTWKTVRVGKVRADGQFDIVWTSDKPVRPVPYPLLRSRESWEAHLHDLHTGWGGSWSAPTGTK
jgi:urea transport system substrate-binding protein